MIVILVSIVNMIGGTYVKALMGTRNLHFDNE